MTQTQDPTGVSSPQASSPSAGHSTGVATGAGWEGDPELNTSAIVLWGFFGAIATFAIIIGLQILYLVTAQNIQRGRASPALSVQTRELRTKNKDELARLAWRDQEAGRVKIPIETAEGLVLRALQEGTTPTPEPEPPEEPAKDDSKSAPIPDQPMSTTPGLPTSSSQQQSDDS